MKGIKNLYKWAKKYLWMILFLLGLNYVLQYTYSFLPLLVQYAFKVIGGEERNVNLPSFLINIFEKGKEPLMVVLIVGISMVSIQAGRSVMRFIANYGQNVITENISRDMKVKMYSHITDLSYSYHNNVDTGDLIQRCTSDVETSSKFVSTQFPELVNIFVTIGIGAYQVYHINVTLMWVSMIIIPITGIASVIYFAYVNKAFKKIEKQESKMTSIIQQNVNNSRVVRVFATEKYEFDKMDEASREYTKATEKFNSKMALFWGFMDGSVTLQYGLTILVSIMLAKKGLVDMADITACLLLLGMLIWPIRGLGRIIAQFGKTIVGVNRLEEVLEEKIEFEDNGTLTPKITGKIEFKDVHFEFKDDNTKLLKGVTFDINPGETVAIVGKTGSGKSTICNILTRMLDYDTGSVLIDGIELKDIEKKHLRRNIKMVPQDPFLFSKTIYENISITDKLASKEKVYHAADIANIADEIDRFELGYDTIVGEKGTTLSGGQKQRVAIARILVDESPVIIFDDSLSALDNKTDLMIRKALKNRENFQTMIIVTHRTTTAKEADKIIVVENGIIKEVGTHEQLANKEGLYKELWGIQGQLEKEFIKLIDGGEVNE